MTGYYILYYPLGIRLCSIVAKCWKLSEIMADTPLFPTISSYLMSICSTDIDNKEAKLFKP